MNNLKEIASSYGRAFLAAIIACYLAGVTDPKALIASGLAAILPPLLRWLNPQDGSFGYIKVKDNSEH